MTRREVTAEGLAEPISHYADAVVAGGVVYISGIVPVDAEGAVVGGDVVAQAEQVFAIMGRVLAAGSVRLCARNPGPRRHADRRMERSDVNRGRRVVLLCAGEDCAARAALPSRPAAPPRATREPSPPSRR